MAQQPQQTAQAVFGPANGGGDILHFAAGNAIAPNGFLSWFDNNGMQSGVSGVFSGLSSGAAATITAAAGGVFTSAAGVQRTVSLPGNGAYEQVPFVVKASGTVTLAAGTYTATVQPLIYASTTATFAAAVGNAIFSAAAVSITYTSATPVTSPWELEFHLVGDSVSGKLAGWQTGNITGGGTTLTPTLVTVAAAPAANAPTSINFLGSAPPISFAAGVTLGGAAPATSTVSLGALIIES